MKNMNRPAKRAAVPARELIHHKYYCIRAGQAYVSNGHLPLAMTVLTCKKPFFYIWKHLGSIQNCFYLFLIKKTDVNTFK